MIKIRHYSIGDNDVVLKGELFINESNILFVAKITPPQIDDRNKDIHSDAKKASELYARNHLYALQLGSYKDLFIINEEDANKLTKKKK
jgi:hypothetical protein